MNPSSLYIHIPFCSRKCLFCSFVVTVGQEHRREEYVEALIQEMKNNGGQRLTSIYFGGGTPSLLDENHLDVLMEGIRKFFSFQNDIEITIEANPESIDLNKARFLKSKGFNRVSLGVQSMDERYLKFLGRAHDALAARQAYDSLREAGLDNVSLDLMYGFPGQSAPELQKDVEAICSFGSEHLSLYTLTIEPHSKFYADQMKLDDDAKLATHYVVITRYLEEHGFKQYEISNFAKPGFQATHNKNYWQGGRYIGLGLGAHGFTGHRRYWNVSRLQDYLGRMQRGEEARESFEDLTDHQIIMERILFGLRMNEGIAWEIVPGSKQPQIQEWIKDGFLSLDQGRLKAMEKGRLILDELSARLI